MIDILFVTFLAVLAVVVVWAMGKLAEWNYNRSQKNVITKPTVPNKPPQPLKPSKPIVKRLVSLDQLRVTPTSYENLPEGVSE